MYLNYETYQDKVKACWLGKNIGGTIGTPYEGKRDIFDVKGFSSAPGEPLPNDDLDLQLVWLHALEHIGPQNITAAALGEFWLSFIHPGWNEYGIGKANMVRGILPPASGDFENDWKHSNGAWIRTEIWATAAPAIPELAAKFAMEDAKVDHGVGEGTVAAAFVAAMQSAAFVLTSLYDCIDVGLAAIPADSRVAKSVRLVLDSYKAGKSWQDTRNAVLEQNADIGNGWFEAPSNVAYAVIGLVYGEGDFKKSVLLATNCGDDTDCTAATAGATMGILYGTAGIPADWVEYIGDKIVTGSLAQGDVGRLFPKTCSELTERVVALAPTVLYFYTANLMQRYANAAVLFGKEDLPEDLPEFFRKRVSENVCSLLAQRKPYGMHFKQAFIEADLTLSDVRIAPLGEISVDITLNNDIVYDNNHRPLALRWLLPDGFTAECPKSVFLPRIDNHYYDGKVRLTAKIHAPEVLMAENRIILEVTAPGRPTALYASFVLVG